MSNTSRERLTQAQNGQNSYVLSEEIDIRARFASKRKDSLADYFRRIFQEMDGDIHRQARLVDIGLRYENNIPLNLAAAAKIRFLLDEHKILLIPAHIGQVPPPVAETIAKAIISIHEHDPRQYFLERGATHPNPAVRRICLSALAYTRCMAGTDRYSEQTLLSRPALNSSRAKPENKLMQTKTAKQPKIELQSQTDLLVQAKALPQAKAPLHAKALRHAKAPREGTQPVRITEDLISLISGYIIDGHAPVRLKWVNRIGEIPAKEDPEDNYKSAFISTALKDPVQAVCLAAIAQIAFLLHDESKLAILLKIININPDLISSSRAQAIIDSLPGDMQKKLKQAANPGTPLPLSFKGASGKKRSAEEGFQKTRDDPARMKEQPSAKTASAKPAPDAGTEKENAKPELSGKSAALSIIPPGNSRTAEAGRKNKKDASIPGADKAVIKEILSELDLSAEMLAELKDARNPVNEIIRELAVPPELPKTDNYFLRHTAVLHVRDIKEEALRYQLYLAVLRSDPKDIVRAIVIQEAQNLKMEHVRALLALGLKDSAWQVRSGVIEYLIPLLPDRIEQKNILGLSVNDRDYHIRQKVSEGLNSLSLIVL